MNLIDSVLPNPTIVNAFSLTVLWQRAAWAISRPHIACAEAVRCRAAGRFRFHPHFLTDHNTRATSLTYRRLNTTIPTGETESYGSLRTTLELFADWNSTFVCARAL